MKTFTTKASSITHDLLSDYKSDFNIDDYNFIAYMNNLNPIKPTSKCVLKALYISNKGQESSYIPNSRLESSMNQSQQSGNDKKGKNLEEGQELMNKVMLPDHSKLYPDLPISQIPFTPVDSRINSDINNVNIFDKLREAQRTSPLTLSKISLDTKITSQSPHQTSKSLTLNTPNSHYLWSNSEPLSTLETVSLHPIMPLSSNLSTLSAVDQIGDTKASDNLNRPISKSPEQDNFGLEEKGFYRSGLMLTKDVENKDDTRFQKTLKVQLKDHQDIFSDDESDIKNQKNSDNESSDNDLERLKTKTQSLSSSPIKRRSPESENDNKIVNAFSKLKRVALPKKSLLNVSDFVEGEAELEEDDDYAHLHEPDHDEEDEQIDDEEMAHLSGDEDIIKNFKDIKELHKYLHIFYNTSFI